MHLAGVFDERRRVLPSERGLSMNERANCLLLALLLLDLVLGGATAEGKLVLAGGSVGIETELAALLGNLLHVKLGQVIGDHEGPALLNVCLGIDDVDFLELTTGGLHKKEVGDGDTDEVNESEEEVDTPAGGGGEERSEHDDGKVGDPVGTGGGGGTSGTGTEGVDLGRVDPGERQESEGEEDDEEEDTDNGTL